MFFGLFKRNAEEDDEKVIDEPLTFMPEPSSVRFDFYDPSTWDYYENLDLVANLAGVTIYCTNGEPMTRGILLNLLKGEKKLAEKENKIFNPETFLNKLIKTNCYDAIHQKQEEKKEIEKKQSEIKNATIDSLYDLDNALNQSESYTKLSTFEKDRIRRNCINELNLFEKLISEDEKLSPFSPLDKKTWKYASDQRLLMINHRYCYDYFENDKKHYLFETDFIKNYKEYKKEFDENIEIKDYAYDFIPKDNRYHYLVVVNGFGFTEAMYDLVFNKNDLEKVANAMLFCINNNYQKHNIKQYLFDNQIPVDNYLFTDLYFAEKNNNFFEVEEILSEYYSGFDDLESKSEFNKLLRKSTYLAEHPEVKKEIKERCF